MGYLEKPHTSAGRVPSHKGYRFYVDHLMRRPVAPISAKDETALMALKRKEARPPHSRGRTPDFNSLTNYAAVAVTPHLSHMTIRQFELISVDERTYVVVIVTDANVVKNKLVHTAAPVTKAEESYLAYVLNQNPDRHSNHTDHHRTFRCSAACRRTDCPFWHLLQSLSLS